MGEIQLMKGNEAIAEAAIRAGCDAYFGYPITPQSEILEYLAAANPEKRTGMIVLQAESELAAINMVYGAAAAGKKVMTTSSSPGISLMQEGLSYMAGAQLPGVIVNVVRGGPGLGTIQPSQSDYFQSTKGGGHGDYRLLVLAPASVQEMSDHVKLAFDLAFKYRNPVLILTDGLIGQMMEKVELFDPVPRSKTLPDWAACGKKGRPHNIITSLHLDAYEHEKMNQKLKEKYALMQKNEVRYETYYCEDADYLIVAYGASARISQKTVTLARNRGIKLGLLRPITLFPFPSEAIARLAAQLNGILSVEMSHGQMVEDVLLATRQYPALRVEHFGRFGGVVHTPEEILEAFIKLFIQLN
ncbi:MAG: 3-methyl-2-oxobutanoate dehydrogenase subunit VorB [Bacteroidales bacterium]|nr:3-methyl-2-oxobutanoate dehydrogenase subunit VorB [Bacteroidales bacterium]